MPSIVIDCGLLALKTTTQSFLSLTICSWNWIAAHFNVGLKYSLVNGWNRTLGNHIPPVLGLDFGSWSWSASVSWIDFVFWSWLSSATASWESLGSWFWLSLTSTSWESLGLVIMQSSGFKALTLVLIKISYCKLNRYWVLVFISCYKLNVSENCLQPLHISWCWIK